MKLPDNRVVVSDQICWFEWLCQNGKITGLCVCRNSGEIIGSCGYGHSGEIVGLGYCGKN